MLTATCRTCGALVTSDGNTVVALEHRSECVSGVISVPLTMPLRWQLGRKELVPFETPLRVTVRERACTFTYLGVSTSAAGLVSLHVVGGSRRRGEKTLRAFRPEQVKVITDVRRKPRVRKP